MRGPISPGAFMAKEFAKSVSREGTTIYTSAGTPLLMPDGRTPVRAIVQTVSLDQMEQMVNEGVAVNAANADYRILLIPPASLATPFTENDNLYLQDGGALTTHKIVRFIPPVKSGDTIVYLRYLTARTAQPDAATAALPGEPNPGTRKEYAPPDQA